MIVSGMKVDNLKAFSEDVMSTFSLAPSSMRIEGYKRLMASCSILRGGDWTNFDVVSLPSNNSVSIFLIRSGGRSHAAPISLFDSFLATQEVLLKTDLRRKVSSNSDGLTCDEGFKNNSPDPEERSVGGEHSLPPMSTFWIPFTKR